MTTEQGRRRPARQAVLLALLALACAGEALAQQTIDVEQTLAFDRTEAWAMKYFTAVALPTSVGAPDTLDPGSLILGFEGGYVPQLNDAQRRVGFNGTKLEDVNKTKFFGRVRGRIGLPARLAVDVGFVPPVEVNGARPSIFFAALDRTFAPSAAWRIGVRGFGQWGTIEADITCSADEVAAGFDLVRNPYFCEEASEDRLTQQVAGGEVTFGHAAGRVRPYAGVVLSYVDLSFEVNARYAGLIDRTRQHTDGAMAALTGGVTVAPSDRWLLGAVLFYAPLSVIRPPGTESEHDGLFNARVFASLRLR